ncbi:MAG: hypothetical protein WD823_07970 [Sulfuricaulis sp.]|uniref:hypothetical protein n=1 Tax=Sulfuricaulis sp. TaxID=2003553 RepID=UPI0034A24ABF
MKILKLLVAVVIAIGLIAVIAYLIDPQGDTTRKPPPGVSGGGMRNQPPADRAAIAATREQLGAYFNSCGNQYVTHYPVFEPIGGGGPSGGPVVGRAVNHSERYLDVTFESHPRPLTDIDRLNKIDWTGTVVMKARAWGRGPQNVEWSAAPERIIGVEKKPAGWVLESPWIDSVRAQRSRKEPCP